MSVRPPEIDFTKPPAPPSEPIPEFTRPYEPHRGRAPEIDFTRAPAPGARQRSPVTDLISKYATQHGIPTDLAHRLVTQESGGNIRAKSKVGAMGVMQLMPGTAKALGVRDPYDPDQNIEAGMRYLRQQYDRFGTWDKALAAYNAGPGAVEKHRGIPPYRETQQYVRNILGGVQRGISGAGRRAAEVLLGPAPAPVAKAVELAGAPAAAIERAATGGPGYGEGVRRLLRPVVGEAMAEALGSDYSPFVLPLRMGYDPVNWLLGAVGFARSALRPRPPVSIATTIPRRAPGAVPAVELAPPRGISAAVRPKPTAAPPEVPQAPAPRPVRPARPTPVPPPAVQAPRAREAYIERLATHAPARPMPELVIEARQMHEAARKAAPAFLDESRRAAAAGGARFVEELAQHAVKKPQRIITKLAQGFPVRDALRTTMEVTSRDQLDNTLAGYRREGYRVLEVTDRWTDPQFADWSYKDVQVKLVREGDPLIREVQFITPAMLKAKGAGAGHEVYLLARNLPVLRRIAEQSGYRGTLRQVEDLERVTKRQSDAVYAPALVSDSTAMSASVIPRRATAASVSTMTSRSKGPLSSSERRSAKGLLKTISDPRLAKRISSSEISRGISALLRPSAIEGPPPSTSRVAPRPGTVQIPKPGAAQPRGLAAVVPEPPAAVGQIRKATTPVGNEVDAQYAVVSARRLRASHDTSLRANPDYPQEIQPRQRGRAASRQQLANFVENTRFDQLGVSDDIAHGAPIVGDDLVVESGNMRSIGMKALYEQNHPNAARYREWLNTEAPKVGIDPAAYQDVPDPVLVRIRKTPVDRVRFAREANMGTTLKMSPVEQAQSDAALVSDDLMRLFQPGEEGEVASRGNRDFIARFIQTVAPTPAEQGDLLLPNGQLSAQGIRRVQNAVLAKAYGDVSALEKMIEAPDVNVRNIANALLAAAPRMAQMRAKIVKGELFPLDVSETVARAMTKLSELRESGTPVNLFLSQTEMFPDPSMTTEARRILQIFGEAKSRKRITEFLNAYVDAAEALGNPQQIGLAGVMRETPKVGDVIEAAVKKARGADVGQLPLESRTNPATSQNLQEVAPEIAAGEQAGYVRLGGGLGAPAQPAGVSPRVQQMLAMGRPGVRERLGESVRRAVEGLRNWLVPEGALINVRTAPRATWQEVRDDFRLFRDVPRTDVPEAVTKDILGVVRPLERADYDIFQNYVFMRDLAEEYQVARTVGRRPSIPLGLSEEEVTQALQAYEGTLTPKARAAVERHDRLKVWQRDEFIRRGHGDAEDFREYHMRHFVMDYDDLYGGGVGVPKRMREPQRTGLKGRKGSEKPILTDYIEVMQKDLSRFYLDNAIDDFMADLKPKVDWLPHLTPEQRVAAFGQRGKPTKAGQLVTLDDGTRLVTWQYQPGNRIFPGYTLDSRLLEGVTNRTLTVEELAALLGDSNEGRKAARQMLVLGQKHPMILIDPKMAQRLNQFNQGGGRAQLFEAVGAFSSVWKRAIVDSLGLPFQFRNMLGDIENGWVVGGGRTEAATPWVRAAQILGKEAYGKALTPQEQQIIDLAKRYRVIRSGFVTGTLRTPVSADPRLTRLRPRGEQLARMPGRALGEYERLAGIREDATRLAHFMDNLERIQKGQTIRMGAVDVRGLKPIRAAGKVAREAFVDYGWKSPMEEQLGRGALAPFISWYYQNTGNWVKTAARTPGALVAKSVPLYAAMAAWNNTGERREIEENLPPWQRMMPHIITGWRLPDGRPLVIGFSGGSASAAQTLGLTRVFEAANEVRSGEFTTEEAIARLPGGILQEIGRGAAFQMGPVVTAPVETGMFAATRGRTAMDVRRGQERVPERLRGTAAGGRIFASQQAQQLLPPLGIAMRQQEFGRQLPPGTTPAQRGLLMTGLARPVDLAAEQRRRTTEIIAREKAAREDKLFAVERAWIESGDPQKLREEAQRQNGRAGPKLTGKEITERIVSTRVRIERLRQQIRTNTDPAQAAALREALNKLLAQDVQERTKRAPRSVRPLVAPKVQRRPPVEIDFSVPPPQINFEEAPRTP